MGSREQSRRRRGLQRARSVVTDHAVVRWLERVEGLEVDHIRRHIMQGSVPNVLEASNGYYAECRHPDGPLVVCKDGRVVTIRSAN